MFLENFVFSVIGRRGSGKTQLANLIASDYPVVYANYWLKIKGCKVYRFSGTLNFGSDGNAYLGNILLQKTNHKEIIVVDEAGINYNSKKFQSQENMDFSEFVVVSRKYNKDIVFITTQDYSINKDFRFETNYWFNCQKHFDEEGKFYTLVEKLVLNRKTGDIELLDDFKCYGVDLMEKIGIKYDTTDIAKISKEPAQNPETGKKLRF